VPLTRADCVCHLAEFASQSLWSWTRSACCVVDSCILAILRERSLRALVALSTSISCAHHGASACDRLLRACLPNFLSIIQTLILRTQRSSQWLAIPIGFLRHVAVSVFAFVGTLVRVE